MTQKCEKCFKKEAVVHIAEMMDGMILTRDLCEECANVRTMSEVPPLRWTCHCGDTVEWRYSIPNCGHSGGDYVMAGETEKEVAVCSCGVHFIARFSIWRCEICGQECLFPPKLGGSKGFLRDYIYGNCHSAKIEIKGVKDKS